MYFRRQLKLLVRDLEFYCVEYPSRDNKYKFARWVFSRLCSGLLYSRDFRLNILVRLSLSRLIFVSSVAESLIFYVYGSTISSNAILDCRLRFCHARSLVIGPRVKMTGEFAYIFNNVTIGKLIPGSPKQSGDMPHFLSSVVFGVGSAVYGPLVATHDIVFASNSFCSLKEIKQDSTVWGTNNVKYGVFFNRRDHVDKPHIFTPPKWAQIKS